MHRLLPIAVLLTPACGGRAEGLSSPTPSHPVVRAVAPCGLFADATFRSVKEFDTGLGPDGPVLGSWTVRFRGPMVSYQVSDTWRSAPYTCTGGAIRGEAAGDPFEGRYEPATRTLVWNGEAYTRVE